MLFMFGKKKILNGHAMQLDVEMSGSELGSIKARSRLGSIINEPSLKKILRLVYFEHSKAPPESS